VRVVNAHATSGRVGRVRPALERVGRGGIRTAADGAADAVRASTDGGGSGGGPVDGTDGRGRSGGDDGFGDDELFGILRSQRRRRVLRRLREADGDATLSDLARQVAAAENRKPVDALRSQEYKRVYISLYQTHLPKMDEAGVVEFDRDRGSVRRGPNADAVYARLDSDPGARRPWHRYYLALAAANLLALAASTAVGGEPAVAAAFGLSVLALGALGLVHARASD